MILVNPVRIISYPQGPRVWVLNQRLHHGATGCALTLMGVKWRALALVGLVLVAHDRADWRAWFAREKCDESHTTALDTELSTV